MKIIVSTCDKYDHLLPGFAMQWNRHWGAPVTVLGFRQPPLLPENFEFISMGEESRSWSAHIRDEIARMRDREIIFLFDDYWLTARVDQAKVERMRKLVEDGAVKGDLSRNTVHFAHRDIGGGLVEAAADAQYRTSTQPAVWDRSYLLSLLGTGEYNPWQFELQHTPEVTRGSIIGSHEQIVRFANIYYKGEPMDYAIDSIPTEERLQLKSLNLLPNHANQPIHP